MGTLKTPSLEVRGTLDYIQITLALMWQHQKEHALCGYSTSWDHFVLCNFESQKYVLRIEQASAFQCGVILPSQSIPMP